jgi:hypothetical protein
MDTTILEPTIRQIITEGIRPQINDAIRMAVKYKAETGFLIYFSLEEKKQRLKVWTDDITVGSKYFVPLDPQLKIGKELLRIIEKEPVERVVETVRKHQYRRHPNLLGDFHVHLFKAPISLVDMIQTMLSNGLITVLGQPLNANYAKITYLIWKPMEEQFKDVLVEAVRGACRVYTYTVEKKKAGECEQKECQRILHSGVVKQYSLNIQYAP